MAARCCVLLLGLALGSQGLSVGSSTCATMMCRPGRECRQRPGGAAHCACLLTCPDHWKPVCGSDGTSYDNHCSLHRAACSSGAPVSPLHPGFCRREQPATGEAGEGWEGRQTPSPLLPLPSACSQRARDSLLESLAAWLRGAGAAGAGAGAGAEKSAEKQAGQFTSADRNADGFLDSQELMDFLPSNVTEGPLASTELRQLCLDAVVEEGDTDYDWRLGRGELARILRPGYTPSDRECSLGGRQYRDGDSTQLQCNSCVCACGKWICTSEKCPQGYRGVFDRINRTTKLIDEEDPEDRINPDDDYDDEYYEDYEEYEDDYNNPEDDPDVQDIPWF